jgi:hypothetical protein
LSAQLIPTNIPKQSAENEIRNGKNSANGANNDNSFSKSVDSEIKNILSYQNSVIDDRFDSIINKYGGETTTHTQIGTSNFSNQQQFNRNSRPSSSQSLSFSNRGNMFPGSSGGSGGGQYPTNNSGPFEPQDLNRQILLLLVRLQQDTNNVMTRLSCLETTVMSLQVSRRLRKPFSIFFEHSQIFFLTELVE